MEEFRAYFESIKVGEHTLILRQDSIVCLVGPNGSGKTAALEFIYGQAVIHQKPLRSSTVTAAQFFQCTPDYALDDIIERLPIHESGHFIVQIFKNQVAHIPRSTDRDTNRRAIENSPYLPNLLVYFVGARERLQIVEPTMAVDPAFGHKQHPFHFIHDEPKKEDAISQYTQRLFGKDFFLNRFKGPKLAAHLGNKSTLPDLRIVSKETIAAFNSLADITHEGAGLQAAVGLLAAVFATEYKVIFIDEPDVFLHPPQAVALGQIFTEEREKQIVLSTHSARFLQGLAEKAPDRLKIVRLGKSRGHFTAKLVDPDVLKSVQSDPLLRFTGVLDTLFHDLTIICENERDALVYDECLRRMGLWPNDNAPLFLSSQGKAGLSKVAKLCRQLQSNLIVVADFDILDSKERKVLDRLVQAVDGDWPEISKELGQLDRILENNSLSWHRAKNMGVDEFRNCADAHLAANQIIERLKGFGILVVRHGELENLREPCAPKGEGCVPALIDGISTAPELERARKFITELSGLISRTVQAPNGSDTH